MKNDQLSSSNKLSVVCCLRKTKGLLSSFLPTLAFAIVLTLLVTPFLFAQQRWERTYGGTRYEDGRSVNQTQDGGYIVVGYTNSFGSGNSDVYLIKANASGDTLWTRTYGGAGDDWGRHVQQTSDLGYIVTGYTTTFGDSFQVYLIKTNAGGDTLWTRTYGGVHDDWGLSAQQTSDGGYVVTGFTNPLADNSLVYLIKTNAGGDTLWTKTFGGVEWNRGNSVQQTTDGGYIIAGETTSFGNLSQVYLIKTDANGNVGVETPVRPLNGSTVESNPQPLHLLRHSPRTGERDV